MMTMDTRPSRDFSIPSTSVSMVLHRLESLGVDIRIAVVDIEVNPWQGVPTVDILVAACKSSPDSRHELGIHSARAVAELVPLAVQSHNRALRGSPINGYNVGVSLVGVDDSIMEAYEEYGSCLRVRNDGTCELDDSGSGILFAEIGLPSTP